MLGVSMITRGPAARAWLTVSAAVVAGAPGGAPAPGRPAAGVALGCASLAGEVTLAWVCAWCWR